MQVVGRYYMQTLGCPKNQVDSDKLEGYLVRQGYARIGDPAGADLVVVNTCAFIEGARQESIETVLDLDDRRADDSRLVVTGCMAERYGKELAEALPEADAVLGFDDYADITERLQTILSGGQHVSHHDDRGLGNAC